MAMTVNEDAIQGQRGCDKSALTSRKLYAAAFLHTGVWDS